MNDPNSAKPFSCANCGKQLPVKRLWTLTNFSKIKCKYCGTVNRPDIIGPWTFGVTFLTVVISANISLRIRDSILLAMSSGLISALIAYLIIARYIYKTVKFHSIY